MIMRCGGLLVIRLDFFFDLRAALMKSSTVYVHASLIFLHRSHHKFFTSTTAPPTHMKAFAWAAQWYPLAHVRELSKRAPTSHALLDAPLVACFSII